MNENEKDIGQVVQFPCSLQIRSAYDSNESISLNIQQKISTMNFQSLPAEVSLKKFIIGKDVCLEHGTYLIEYTEDEVPKKGLISHAIGCKWFLLSLNCSKYDKGVHILNTSSVPNLTPHILKGNGNLIDELQIKHEKDIRPLQSDSKWEELSINFSLKPPTRNGTNQQPPMQSLEDPLIFLYSRYFSTLYSLTTPLNYFPKTTLTRLKILCKDDNSVLIQCLNKMILHMGEFDERYEGRLGILSEEKSKNGADANFAKLEQEAIYKTDFIDRNSALIHSVNERSIFRVNQEQRPESTDGDNELKSNEKDIEISNEDKLNQLIINLKVREAHLQILIILELISHSDINPDEFLRSSTASNKQSALLSNPQHQTAKRSLVRKKSVKRKIRPTFLGIGFNINEEQTQLSSQEDFTNVQLYSILTAIIDRLGIWDTLLGKTSKSDGSSISFLAYVLVPYFTNKIPSIMTFIIEKIKGSSLKVSRSKSKLKKLKERAKSESADLDGPEMINSPDDSQSLDSVNHIPSMVRSKSTLSNGPPMLSRQNSIPQYDAAPSMKRTSSTISLSTNSLQKRQIDMSVRPSSVYEGKIDATENQSLGRNNKKGSSQHSFLSESAIFGGAKRAKSTLSKATRFKSVSQVEETPLNSRVQDVNNIGVGATPEDSKILKSKFQSTQKSPISRSTIQQRLTRSAVDSSPTRMSPPKRCLEVIDSPFSENCPAIKTDQVIYSSPIVADKAGPRASKPGELISVSESPFYRATLAGSPANPKRKKIVTYGGRARRQLFAPGKSK